MEALCFCVFVYFNFFLPFIGNEKAFFRFQEKQEKTCFFKVKKVFKKSSKKNEDGFPFFSLFFSFQTFQSLKKKKFVFCF
jgi:hypothetical protein